MSYFSDTLTAAIEHAGYDQRGLAKLTGCARSTISKLKTGLKPPNKEELEGLCSAFAAYPDHQLDLIVARCKDVVPAQFIPVLTNLTWTLGEEKSEYSPRPSKWEEAVEKIRRSAYDKEPLRNTIYFLSEIAES